MGNLKKLSKAFWDEPLVFLLAFFLTVGSIHYYFSKIKSSSDINRTVLKNEIKKSSENEVRTNLGTLGDYFGGLLGAGFGFLTLVLVIKQSSELREREDKRDSIELARQDFEVFMRRVEYLEKSLTHLNYKGQTGLVSISEFLDEYLVNRLLDSRSDELYSRQLSFYGPVAMFIRSLNSMFREQYIDVEVALKSKNMPLHLRNNTFFKYKVLNSHFTEEVINHVNRVNECLEEDGLPFLTDKDIDAVKAIGAYLSTNEYYPSIDDIKGITEIFESLDRNVIIR